ncbi:DUF1826 domain-containing protein [Paraglaciecola sp. L3A3]|uniref:DUF1826 domain-containing protein n=1 Tax=Paraglaciecola sp. L3A3 TaxID=2686358 RepID=UPI00131AF3A1|nr:DUF1826 domain-containing protein [Paraglaciecola sp. L3A3]
MELAEKLSLSTWRSDDSPLVLSDIFSPNISVAIWQRQASSVISCYFENAFQSLGMGMRSVFSMKSLEQELNNTLPEYEGKKDAIEDIYLLSDMLTCLFDCDDVGLRLVPLKSAMCPTFHIDNIPVRLVTTYLGSGTQWLPLEALQDQPPKQQKQGFAKTNSGAYYKQSHIQQMNPFDVGLLKGKAWDKQAKMAAVHRSCQLQKNDKRVLLTLDPM